MSVRPGAFTTGKQAGYRAIERRPRVGEDRDGGGKMRHGEIKREERERQREE